ncbi:unnamed protein product [Periconia digitata]|uniref:Uncharacterized protein n=1 Tax=Periconia digitata TaxID=1303443 RepID=A0A9W4UPI9_9PLEO|nr:unnamed protein product [Periconia digitata]
MRTWSNESRGDTHASTHPCITKKFKGDSAQLQPAQFDRILVSYCTSFLKIEIHHASLLPQLAENRTPQHHHHTLQCA